MIERLKRWFREIALNELDGYCNKCKKRIVPDVYTSGCFLIYRCQCGEIVSYQSTGDTRLEHIF